MVMKYVFLVCLIVFSWSVSFAQEADTIFVSCSQTVHVRFDSDLQYVNLGDDVLVARIADRHKEFLAVKANREFDFTTSLFCIESDGEIHSFPVKYSERPVDLMVDARTSPAEHSDEVHVTGGLYHVPGSEDGRLPDFPGSTSGESHFCNDAVVPVDTLQDAGEIDDISFIGLEKEIYHIGHREYGIMFTCDNIFYRHDMLYLVLSVENGSAVSYMFSEPRFALESKRRVKRNLEYERGIVPRRIQGLDKVAPGCSARIVVCFDKVSLLKSQVLKIYLYEVGGARNFVLTLGEKDVNGAGSL